MPISPASKADSCCVRATQPSTSDVAGFAPLFKALGDPTRLEIVILLAAQTTELCVCEIETRFDLSQPTISHHLRVLREAGIVSAERRGTWVHYGLESGTREKLTAIASLFRGPA